MGVRLPERRGATAATIIPSVGCPMGCNFCTTSSFFGGKGKFHNFYETGDELFDLMEGFENSMKVQTFFVMDENFLLHRARAMQLLEHMKAAGKSWVLAVFASANAIRKYSMQELVELGVSWIWMGLESVNSKHAKWKAKTLMSSRTNCASTASACKVPRSLAWSTTHLPTLPQRLSTPSATKLISTSSCCTRLFLVLLYIEK
jgi:pyruvate-formate lyase-activating enzyme